MAKLKLKGVQDIAAGVLTFGCSACLAARLGGRLNAHDGSVRATDSCMLADKPPPQLAPFHNLSWPPPATLLPLQARDEIKGMLEALRDNPVR